MKQKYKKTEKLAKKLDEYAIFCLALLLSFNEGRRF